MKETDNDRVKNKFNHVVSYHITAGTLMPIMVYLAQDVCELMEKKFGFVQFELLVSVYNIIRPVILA